MLFSFDRRCSPNPTPFIMAGLCSRCRPYIFALWFLLSSIFFSSPNLSRRRVDVYHTSTHGVASVRISDAGPKRAARGSLKVQNAKNRHLGTVMQLCRAIFSQLRFASTIAKKLVTQQSPPRPHNMVNFGPLAAEIGSVVWGTPTNVNGFHVLSALLQGTLVVGVSQTLWRSTEGATYIWQGGHHVGHWPTFLVFKIVCLSDSNVDVVCYCVRTRL